MHTKTLALFVAAASSATTAMAHTGNHASLSNIEQVMHMLFYSTPGLWLFALPLALFMTYRQTRTVLRSRQQQKRSK